VLCLLVLKPLSVSLLLLFQLQLKQLVVVC
jgi:hypothetical protein